MNKNIVDENWYDDDARKDSTCCKKQLVIMDIIHAIISTIMLSLYTNDYCFETSDSYWWYDVIATILSYNGIFFNIMIRSYNCLFHIDNLLEYCTLFKCLNLSEARREIYINIGSLFPTIGMIIYGQYIIWSNEYPESDPLGILAWATTWLYSTIKIYGFTRHIYDLYLHYGVSH